MTQSLCSLLPFCPQHDIIPYEIQYKRVPFQTRFPWRWLAATANRSAMHANMRSHPRLIILRIVTIIALVFVWAGCAGRSQQAAKDGAAWSAGEKKSEAGEKAPPLKKTEGSEDSPKSDRSPIAKKGIDVSEPLSTGTAAPSEEEMVRNIAERLVKKHPKAHRMKICHDKKRDEWWITFYEDAGVALELKQYIWNKTRNKTDPFTVLRHISRNDLKEHLAESTPEKPCKALKATENGWTALEAESAPAATKVSPPSLAQPRALPKKQPRPRLPDNHAKAPRQGSSRLQHPDSSSRDRHSSPVARQDADYIFVYGSEMNHPELLKWMESHGYDTSLIHDATPAKLDGYGFVWDYYSEAKGGGTVNIEPREDSSIWGLLVKADRQLVRAFDMRQGHPTTYYRGDRRIPVRRMPDGTTLSAWLYVAKPNKHGRRDVWPTPDYKNRIVNAAKFWDFPSDYVSQIEKWRTR